MAVTTNDHDTEPVIDLTKQIETTALSDHNISDTKTMSKSINTPQQINEYWKAINQHCYLALIQPHDSTTIYNILSNDPELCNRLGDALPYPYTEDSAKQFVEYCSNLYSTTEFEKIRIWCIRDNDTTELIGCIGIDEIDTVNKHGTIGYWLNKQYRGKGIMTDTVNLVLSFAYQQLELHTIHANIHYDNTISENTLKRCYFQYIDTQKQKYEKRMTDGTTKLIDIKHYSLTYTQYKFHQQRSYDIATYYRAVDDNCYLSMYRWSDAPTLYNTVLNDHTITDNLLMWSLPYTIRDAYKHIDNVTQLNHTADTLSMGTKYVIRDVHSHGLIGQISVNTSDHVTYRFGYWLHHSYRNRYIMYNALNVCLDIVFNEMQLPYIESYTFLGNTASERVLQKHWFQHVETNVDRHTKRKSDGITYKLTDKRWLLTKQQHKQKCKIEQFKRSINEHAYLGIVQPTDANAIYTAMSTDTHMLESLLMPPIPYTYSDAVQFIDMIHSKLQSCSLEQNTEFCIRDSTTNALIGGIGLQPHDNNTTHMGYWLHRDYRGKHIISDAVKRMLDIAFDQFNMDTVYARTFVGNTASEYVLQANGFKHNNQYIDKHNKKMCDGSYKVISENEWILTRDTFMQTGKQPQYTINKQQEIATHTISLNEQYSLALLQHCDTDTLHSTIANDSSILDNMLLGPQYTLNGAEQLINTITDQYLCTYNNIYTTYCIRNNSTKQLIGCIWLSKIKPNESCYIGYWLHKEYRRQHIMTVSLNKLLQIAFNQLQCRNVYAETFIQNTASQRLLQKLQFTLYKTYNNKFEKIMCNGAVQSISENVWILNNSTWYQSQTPASNVQFQLSVDEYSYLSLLQPGTESESDAALCYHYVNTDIQCYNAMSTMNTPASIDAASKSIQAIYDNDQYVIDNKYNEFAIRASAAHQLIGRIWLRYFKYNEKCNSASLGYWLAAPYRGKGIMTHTINALVKHAFTTLQLDCITANYWLDNSNSAGVLKRCGFVFSTYLRQRWYNQYADGRRMLMDCMETVLTRDKWLSVQKHQHDLLNYKVPINNCAHLSMYRMSDVDELVHIMNTDSDICDNQLHTIYPFTQHDAMKHITTCIQLNENVGTIDQCYKFCIRDSTTDKLIGSMGLTKLHNTYYVLAYWLHTPYRGQGIIYNALKLFLQHIFERMKLQEIVTYTFEGNTHSEQTLQFHGFKYAKLHKNKYNKIMTDGSTRVLSSKQWCMNQEIYYRMNAIYTYKQRINQYAYLSYITYSDIPTAIQLYNNNPTFIRYSSIPQPFSKTIALEWLNILYTKYTTGTQCTTYAIRCNRTNQYIGCIDLTELDNSTCEVGYNISDAYAGRNIVSDAVIVALSIAFVQLKYDTVKAKILEYNTASQQVLLKNDFVRNNMVDTTAYPLHPTVKRLHYILHKDTYNAMQRIRTFKRSINQYAYLSYMLYSDLKDRTKLLSTDQLIIDNSRFKQPFILNDALEYYNTLLPQYMNNTCTIYVIRDSTTHKYIGDIGLDTHFSTRLDLNYRIDSRYSNKHITSDAVAVVLDIGFKELKLDEIGAISMEHNTISHHILYKYGFERYEFDDSSWQYTTRLDVKRLHFKLSRDTYNALQQAKQFKIPINDIAYLSYMLYSDMKARVRIISTDTDVIHNTWYQQPYTMNDALEYYNTLVEAYKSNTCTQYCIRHNETHKLIGYIGLDRHGNNTYELGYHMDSTYAGQHIMSDAINTVLQIAFEQLQLPYVYATVLQYNAVSQHILQNFHFKHIDVDDTNTTYSVHPNVKRIHFKLDKSNWRS